MKTIQIVMAVNELNLSPLRQLPDSGCLAAVQKGIANPLRKEYNPPMKLPAGRNHLNRVSDNDALHMPRLENQLCSNDKNPLSHSQLETTILQGVHQMHLSAFMSGVNWSRSLNITAADKLQASVISSPRTQHFRQSEINEIILSKLKSLKPDFSIYDTGGRFKSHKKKPESKRLDATLIRTSNGKTYELLSISNQDHAAAISKITATSKITGMTITHDKKLIGRGSYGNVRLGRDVSTGEIVAVKKMRIYRSAREELDGFKLAENIPRVIQPLGHAHVVVNDKIKSYEILPLFNLGDGNSRLEEIKETKLKTRTGANHLMQKTFFEYAEPVASLHKQNISHRDIKLRNYLHSTVKGTVLSDLGLAIHSDAANIGYGTQGYLPPEQNDPAKYTTQQQDIFALGRVFVELIHGTRDIETLPSVTLSIRQNPVPVYFDKDGNLEGLDFSVEPLRHLQFKTEHEAVAGLLAKDPKDRLTVAEFLNTPYMRDYAASHGSEHVNKLKIKSDFTATSQQSKQSRQLTDADIRALFKQAQQNENAISDSEDEDDKSG